MGLCTSGDIFQYKLDNIFGCINRLNTYIVDIIALGKGGFSQHIYRLQNIFSRLNAEGLKVNAPKLILGLKYIPYLGYIITRE